MNPETPGAFTASSSDVRRNNNFNPYTRMTNSEISKRFTLHDLFGFLFPGTLTLIGIGSFAVLNNCEKWDDLAVLAESFRTLHLTVQIFITLVSSYALGLLCFEVGRLVYKICELCTTTIAKKIKNAKNKKNLIRAKKIKNAKIVRLIVDHEKLLTKSIKDEFKTKITKAYPGIETKTGQTFLAYAHLINAGKDQFVQLMSGRAAMFRGLTGSILLIAVGGAIISLFSNGLQLDWVKCTAIFTVLALIFCASLIKVYTFERWWKTHVIFGFLSLEKAVPSETDETASKS